MPPRILAPVILIVIALTAFGVWQSVRVSALSRSVSGLERSVAALDAQYATGILASATTTIATTTPIAAGESARRETLIAKSQDETLQEAVAKATPAVVSIVETRVVPQLEVGYVNPFGRDPFFESFGMRVPVYRQIGTTTERAGAGTGFLVRANGYIVTNKHVVAATDSTYTVLLASGAQRTATVVWRSPTQDLALLKISGTGYPVVPLGDSATLALGQSVFAVGNALGEYNNSVSVGIVSGLNREITAADYDGSTETLTGVIQTDAAINPGNSGGPLASRGGQAVGVSGATVQGSQSIGFAIPIQEVRKALSSLGI
jgi:serine protease Do